MENKIENLLFYAIRSLLCESALSIETLTEEERSALYVLSKKHDVAHLVGHALEKAGLLPRESGVRAKFGKQQMIALLRQERLDYELSQIRGVFEEAEIRFLPLKGAVIRPLYPEAWMRTSCDIDVLVDEETLDTCVSLLCEKLGYKTDGERQFHDVSLYAPSGVHLELHFNILENMETLDGELARVWEFATPMSDGAYEHRMTNEYLTFHTVAHMAYHFVHGGCGIRPLLDLFLMKKKLTLDESVLRSHLSACSLEPFYESLLLLASVWLEGAEATDLTDAMQEYLLTGGVYGSMENRVSVAQGQKGGRFRYLLGRIFLPYADLARKYPVLDRHKFLLPICHIRRWFRLLFGGRAKRSMQELRMSSKISNEQIDRTSVLIGTLGLS